MPVFETRTCDCCGAENVITVFKMGYVDGVVYAGWICGYCAGVLRMFRELAERNQRGRREPGAEPVEINDKRTGGNEDDDAGRGKMDQM